MVQYLILISMMQYTSKRQTGWKKTELSRKYRKATSSVKNCIDRQKLLFLKIPVKSNALNALQKHRPNGRCLNNGFIILSKIMLCHVCLDIYESISQTHRSLTIYKLRVKRSLFLKLLSPLTNPKRI